MVGVETGRHRLQPHKAAEEQAGANEQHQRQRELGHDEQAAQPEARRAEATFGLLRATASLERGVEVDTRCAHGGCQTEDEAGQQCDTKREGEHIPIDADGVETRDVSRVHRANDGEADARNDKTGGATQHSEQQALGQQLAHEPAPRCAERGSNRDFPLPSAGARQQQVGDVGARDQQHESNGSPSTNNDRCTLPTTC